MAGEDPEARGTQRTTSAGSGSRGARIRASPRLRRRRRRTGVAGRARSRRRSDPEQQAASRIFAPSQGPPKTSDHSSPANHGPAARNTCARPAGWSARRCEATRLGRTAPPADCDHVVAGAQGLAGELGREAAGGEDRHRTRDEVDARDDVSAGSRWPCRGRRGPPCGRRRRAAPRVPCHPGGGGRMRSTRRGGMWPTSRRAPPASSRYARPVAVPIQISPPCAASETGASPSAAVASIQRAPRPSVTKSRGPSARAAARPSGSEATSARPGGAIGWRAPERRSIAKRCPSPARTSAPAGPNGDALDALRRPNQRAQGGRRTPRDERRPRCPRVEEEPAAQRLGDPLRLEIWPSTASRHAVELATAGGDDAANTADDEAEGPAFQGLDLAVVERVRIGEHVGGSRTRGRREGA